MLQALQVSTSMILLSRGQIDWPYIAVSSQSLLSFSRSILAPSWMQWQMLKLNSKISPPEKNRLSQCRARTPRAMRPTQRTTSYPPRLNESWPGPATPVLASCSVPPQCSAPGPAWKSLAPVCSRFPWAILSLRNSSAQGAWQSAWKYCSSPPVSASRIQHGRAGESLRSSSAPCRGTLGSPRVHVSRRSAGF